MLVYAISPLRGNYEANTAYAKEIARVIFERGDIPILPHIYFPLFMDDRNPEERNKAMEMGRNMLNLVDAVEVHTRYGISEGMSEEIKYAESLGKKIEYIRYLPHEQGNILIGRR